MTTHDGQHTMTDEDQWGDLNKLKKDSNNMLYLDISLNKSIGNIDLTCILTLAMCPLVFRKCGCE